MNVRITRGFAAVASLVLTGGASADLLGISPGFPVLFYDNTGTLDFTADDGLLSVLASPVSVRFDGGSPPRFVDPTGNPPTETVEIRIIVDEFGGVVGGVPGDDLIIIGEVDQDGDGTADFSGVLLTGEIAEFGFQNVVAADRLTDGSNALAPNVGGLGASAGFDTDEFDFRFVPTGGTLLSLYGNDSIGVTLTSEMSTFEGGFGKNFGGEAKGNVGPVPGDGACCLADGDCVEDIDETTCLAEGGVPLGAGINCTPLEVGDAGTYRLGSHPGGGFAPPFYGLRYDELFDVSAANDRFTFDFSDPQSEMYLDYDGVSTIRIFGTSIGGRDIGAGYDPAWTSLAEIDMTYANVQVVPGDDDLYVLDGNGNTGTLTWLDTGDVFDLVEKADDDGVTFRFGDDDDDDGYRGYSGISGWGWFETTGNFADWLFTADSVCAPPALAGSCCLPDGSCTILTADDCGVLEGSYNGDGTNCDDVTTFVLSASPPPGGLDPSAGNPDSVLTTFNPSTKRFSWIVTFSENDGVLPTGFTNVVNDGPNPKNHPGELASFYYDFRDLSNPILTVYGYNGTSQRNSHVDGNGDGDPGDADQILSSLVSTDWIYELVAESNPDGTLTVGFDIDATIICAHTPMFPDPDTDWEGVGFDELIGYWFHPYVLDDVAYENGFLSVWNGPTGWLDANDEPAEGGACPSVALRVMLVTDDPEPSGPESKRRDLMESWGWQVEFIQDEDSQSAFDALAENVDVAYVSEEVLSNDVGTKLTHASIGIVNEEMALVDELGYAAEASDEMTFDTLKIVDDEHAITRPFGVGTLTVFSSMQEGFCLSDPMAVGCQSLAVGDAGEIMPALLTIEAGGALYPDGFAAGRRVQVPWNGSSFDIDAMNDDGRELMRRAILWAAGVLYEGDAEVVREFGPPVRSRRDVNGDGVVDGSDIDALLQAWGHCGLCAEDVTGDGNVDARDLWEILDDVR